MSRQDTAGEAVAALSQGALENASDVVVLDGERFVGIVSVERMPTGHRTGDRPLTARWRTEV